MKRLAAGTWTFGSGIALAGVGAGMAAVPGLGGLAWGFLIVAFVLLLAGVVLIAIGGVASLRDARDRQQKTTDRQASLAAIQVDILKIQRDLVSVRERQLDEYQTLVDALGEHGIPVPAVPGKTGARVAPSAEALPDVNALLRRAEAIQAEVATSSAGLR